MNISDDQEVRLQRLMECMAGNHEIYCELAPYGSVRLAVCRHCRAVYMLPVKKKDTIPTGG